MSDSVMAASTELVTPNHSSISIVQLTPAIRLKVEKDEELIIILNDDSDRNLSPGTPPNKITFG